MAVFCEAPAADVGMVEGLLSSVDCNVRSLTETSYGALAQPNSPMATALTMMLTLYIAFIGFRLLVGRSPLRIGDITVSAIKIGAVLALATSWPTYQQVVFDVLFKAPEQLAGGLLRAMPSSSLPDAGDIFATLQTVYDRLQSAANDFSSSAVAMVSPLQGGAGWAALTLNASAQLVLLSTLGVVLVSKIVLGLLLGLGPLFIAFLLFDATHGLFEGWLRASLAFALAPLAAIVGLAMQLALQVPALDRLTETQSLGSAGLAAANAVFLLALICAAVSAALLTAMGVIAVSLRLRGPSQAAVTGDRTVSVLAPEASGRWTSQAGLADARRERLQSRALATAAAAMAMDRRDAGAAVAAPAAARADVARRAEIAPRPTYAPLGQANRRHAQPARRASNLRRDR